MPRHLINELRDEFRHMVQGDLLAPDYATKFVRIEETDTLRKVVSARAFAITDADEGGNHEVITGHIRVEGFVTQSLFNSRSMHSFVFSQFAHKLQWPMSQEKCEFRIATPLGKVTRVGRIQKKVQLNLVGQSLPIDLIWVPMEDFDIILGMDWLIRHDTIIHCKQHRISIAKPGQLRWFIPGHKKSPTPGTQLQNRGGQQTIS